MERLGISECTVYEYRTVIYQKLGTNDVGSLVSVPLAPLLCRVFMKKKALRSPKENEGLESIAADSVRHYTESIGVIRRGDAPRC